MLASAWMYDADALGQVSSRILATRGSRSAMPTTVSLRSTSTRLSVIACG